VTHPVPKSWLRPDWPAPACVRAVCTSREGGVSRAPFDTFNLGGRVGDDPKAVAENRARLRNWLRLPAAPMWLRQVHDTGVIDAARAQADAEADAAVTFAPQVICTVLTADCLPVLFCDRAGTRVAAAHAGWRGLLAGVLEKTIDRLGVPGEVLLAWLGPAIGPQAFEVGAEVRRAFLERDPQSSQAFTPSPAGRWLADIYQLARLRLRARGVTAVYGGGLCTYADAARFFSYRRDRHTGRMASLIWREPAA
jgi:polyphenol oxidase